MLQARPRGGFSHSYRSDGSIAWHAYGHTLSAGGGMMLKMNPHSVRPISHNVMLINGQGHRYNLRSPDAPPWIARIMAERSLPRSSHWVADMSPGFPAESGALRWQRHVLFIDEQATLIIDDCAAEKPSGFSWLWQVDQADRFDWQHRHGRFSYTRGAVTARVIHLSPAKNLRMEARQGRAAFANAITGEDHFAEVTGYLERRRGDPRWDFMAGNLDRAAELGPKRVVWTTNAAATKEWTLATMLLAERKGHPAAKIVSHDDASVVLSIPGKDNLTIRWQGDGPADIRIDLKAYREAGAAAR
jgi:hypothetical protein